MIDDQEHENLQRAIRQIRARDLEKDRAFGAVVNLRNDLAEARKRLQFLEVNRTPKQGAGHIDQYRRHVADLESKLSDAETYCRQINPERLAEHDAALADAAEAERQRREQEAAEYATQTEINRQRAARQAQERLQAKARREAAKVALIAS